MKHTFNVEITDTFAGEANYSWVKRYKVKAQSFYGAIQSIAKQHGGGWRKDYDCGDIARYNMAGACVCCFIEYAEE